MAEEIIVIQETASGPLRYKFRVYDGILQWRPSADYAWSSLVNLNDLVGGSDPPNMVLGDGIESIVKITEADYEALENKNESTMYVIVAE